MKPLNALAAGDLDPGKRGNADRHEPAGSQARFFTPGRLEAYFNKRKRLLTLLNGKRPP